MNNISEVLEQVKTMCISGHIRPDGDCVGSCMALYLYIKEWYPEIQVDKMCIRDRQIFLWDVSVTRAFRQTI